MNINDLLFKKEFNYIDLGLLILRIGMGIMFIAHGWGKLTGGPGTWSIIGANISHLGINFGFTFFGFMAGFAETFGGLFLMLGIFWIPINIMLVFNMIVAASYHISSGDGFGGYAHPVEAGILFLSLIFIGPGKYRLIK